MTTTIDTLSRIALEHAQLLAPTLAFVLFLVAQRYLGRWPDLWRARRLVLPVLDRLADGEYDDELEAVEGHTSIDVSAAADALPEKTGLRLNARTLVGTIDAPPSEVRDELRSMDRVYPNTLASIQFDVDKGTGERVWEVGSYAYRPEGFFGFSRSLGASRRETPRRSRHDPTADSHAPTPRLRRRRGTRSRTAEGWGFRRHDPTRTRFLAGRRRGPTGRGTAARRGRVP